MTKGDADPDLVLASVLRRMREERGLAREAVAFAAGVSTGSLTRIELGQSIPSWTTVRAVIAALEVSLEELGAEVEASE
jgi:XRE family transcriptional regulator, regulator of sulfur utilization